MAIENFSTSEIKCYKKCRKLYWFKYMELLKKALTEEALFMGTTYHDLVKVMMQQDVQAGLDHADELRKQSDSNENHKLIDITEIMAEHYMKHAGDLFLNSCKIISLEKEFEVKYQSYGSRLVGAVDGVLELINGDRVILEHKTAKTVNEEYFHRLQWEEQASNYIYAMKKEGHNIVGMLYMVIEKFGSRPRKATPIEKRKYKKDGTLYANQRSQDESHSEFLARVREFYDEGCKLHHRLIYRTGVQLEEHEEYLKNITKEIKATRKKPEMMYRNPAACQMLSCSFDTICLEDSPELRAVNFTKKDSRHEELKEVF